MRMGLSYPVLQLRQLDCARCIQSAFSTADTPQLLLGSDDGLVAVDPSTLAVQWSIRRSQCPRNSRTIQQQGIVVVATRTGLHAIASSMAPPLDASPLIRRMHSCSR